MTVFKALTEADIAEYRLNPEFLRYLEAFRREKGLEPQHVRVLDWGCGRGQATIALERLGYNAMGADIHPHNGHPADLTGAEARECSNS